MNAALSKDNEIVEFIWDSSSLFVRLCLYDFDKGPNAYSDKIEKVCYARRYWKGLLESGFRRGDNELKQQKPVAQANR